MDGRKKAVPLKPRGFTLLVCVCLTATPTRAFDYIFQFPTCAEINLPTVVIPPCDGGSFFSRMGRSFYGPFVQDGTKIEIQVEALTAEYEGTPLPLYFELIPGSCDVCAFGCRGFSVLVWQTFGTLECSWSSSGEIEVPLPLFPNGTEYWVRLTSFARRAPGQIPQTSPVLRDVRIRSGLSPIAAVSWSHIKKLFD